MLFDLLTNTPANFTRDIFSFKPTGSACAATIGSFRSLHKGHRQLVNTLIEGARARGLKSMVVSFHPSPYEVLSQTRLPAMLNNATRRLLLSSWGVEFAIQHNPSREFLRMSAEDFVEKVLLDRLKVKWLVIGDDFHFGYKRAGDISLLKRYESAGDLEVFQMSSVVVNDRRVSTTSLTEAMTNEDYALVRTQLGRPWSIIARVSSGSGVARQLGYPTLNIPLPSNLQSPHGIFAGVVEVPGLGVCQAAVNIGVRPTISSSGQRVLEAFLLDRTLNHRPGRVAVHLLHRIRHEQKFESPQELRVQIGDDLKDIREYFSYSTLLRGLC